MRLEEVIGNGQPEANSRTGNPRMKILFISLLFFLPAIPQTAHADNRIAITHVSIVDATDVTGKPDMTVVISGNQIEAVGKTSEVEIPEGIPEEDAQGRFLIPGLWDMHVHIFRYDPRRSFDPVYFPLMIANGVTGVRDMWTDEKHLKLVQQWRKQVDRSMLLAPRIGMVGPIVDGPRPTWRGSISVSSPDDGKRVVASLKETGMDFVKIYTGVPRNVYFSIAEEAKRLGITFAGHVPASITAAEASDAGQKSIEHLEGVLLDCAANEEQLRAVNFRHRGPRYIQRLLGSYDDRKARTLFSLLAKNGTWQCPTLTALRAYSFRSDPADTLGERLKYVDVSEQAFCKQLLRMSVTRKNYFEKALAIVSSMHTAGVEILAGTDLASPYLYAGFSLHDELELLVEAGLTPMEALKTATINPARFLGIEDSYGTIEVGKTADLVLLDANPLESISNTKKIYAVVLNGKILPKERLTEMLAEVESTVRATPPSSPTNESGHRTTFPPL